MYLKSDTLLLVDVLENCRKMCLEIYQLDLEKSLLADGLAWHADFKKSKVKLDLLTDTNLLLMVKKTIRSKVCHSINGYVKTKNKYMRDYKKNEEF